MIIEYANGTRVDIADHNLTRLFHYIPSADVEHTSASVECIGEIVTHTQIKNRVISVEFMVKSYDLFDYYLLRDEINALFTRDDAFYIIFKREPYKRYKVRLAKQFEVPPQKRLGKFTVEFITVQRFAESIASISDLKEWDTDKWAWNGLISWDDDLQYTFDDNTFTVANLGNVVIDPRYCALDITLTGVFSRYVTITNTTTGDVYTYNGALTASDTLVLSGVKSLKNGVSVFKDTNKKLITLAVGNNIFTVEGGTVNSIAFNFRFLYK